MTAIFSPYHRFSNYGLFRKAFNDFKNRGRVAAPALDLLRYCTSSSIKLHSSQHHMNTLLSYETVIISPPPSTSGVTGSTISVTSISTPTDYDVSRELDGFFANLFSSFDIFAQIVNMVYLTSPLSTGKVSFYRMWGAMKRIFPNDALTRFMTSLLAKQWYKDLKGCRKVPTHRHEIEFTIERSRGFMEPLCRTKIVLPDNPFSVPPTYSLRREFETFGVNIFQRAVNAIDHMYGIMEARIRVAGRIPI